MRQTLSAYRFLAIAIAAGLAVPAWHAWGAEGESVRVSVQGVLATREGEEKLTPAIAPGLDAFADVLKRFPYNKFDDIGGGSGVVKAGQQTTIKVGSHSISATLVEIDMGMAKIMYTVKDAKGNSIGSNAMALAPGQIVPVQVGEPAFPVILLFQAGK
jgi:hypothetical protein